MGVPSADEGSEYRRWKLAAVADAARPEPAHGSRGEGVGEDSVPIFGQGERGGLLGAVLEEGHVERNAAEQQRMARVVNLLVDSRESIKRRIVYR
jgi:hypothetical protein